jgi:hypothetical protein
VEVLVPGSTQLLLPLNPSDNIFYHAPHVPLTFFLQADVRVLLETGQLLATSVRAPVDQMAAAALVPPGHLILSLDKDTYERLGLTGRASHFHHTQRYGKRDKCTIVS